MGTRSNTIVIETGHEKEFVLVNIYRQFDGYPSVHGKELSKIVSGTTLCNGLPFAGDGNEGLANGAGCFAAQLIKALKDGPGEIYIDRPEMSPGEEYTYQIRVDTYEPTKGFDIQVSHRSRQIFRGNAEKFAEFVNSPD